MPRGQVFVQARGVHFLVEVEHDASGRIVGTVAPDIGRPQPFDGWLELARLLETGEEHRSDQDGVATPSKDVRAARADTSEVST